MTERTREFKINMNQFLKDLVLRREMVMIVWMYTKCDITPKHKGTQQQVPPEAATINKDVGFLLTAIQFSIKLILI